MNAATHSAPGSRVVYDCLLRDVIEGRFEGHFAAMTRTSGRHPVPPQIAAATGS